jgi:hypothetical protein
MEPAHLTGGVRVHEIDLLHPSSKQLVLRAGLV